MDILFLIGRILFGGFFLMSGMNHFLKSEILVSYSRSKKVPMPNFSVLFSGLFLVLAGLFIILGIFIKFAVFLLVIFFVLVSFKMHNFWTISDPQENMMQKMNFMKNMAFLGASLMMLAISYPWAYSLM